MSLIKLSAQIMQYALALDGSPYLFVGEEDRDDDMVTDEGDETEEPEEEEEEFEEDEEDDDLAEETSPEA